jgi:hypothetical protein
MSFILDALKKAEETRQQATPSILGKVRVPKPIPRRPRWPWVLGAAVLLVANVGVVAYVLWPRGVALTERPRDVSGPPPAVASASAEIPSRAAGTEPRPTAAAPPVALRREQLPEPSVDAAASAPPAPPKPVERTAAAAPSDARGIVAPSSPPVGGPSTLSSPPAVRAPSAPSSLPPVSPPATPPGLPAVRAPSNSPLVSVPAPPNAPPASAPSVPPSPLPASAARSAPSQPVVSPPPTSTALTPPRPAAVPPPAELSTPPRSPLPAAPSGGDDELSKLKLTVHVWADKPGERLVFINGRKYVQGDRIENKAVLEEITQEGALVSYQGRRSLLRP